MKTFLILGILLISASCSKNNNRMKEKAAMESESATISQMGVENANLAEKARRMEEDLARRHLFYQALKGVYEGNISTNLGQFNIRLTFTPSLAPLPVGRIRQLEEIASDLNALAMNVQVIQWDPNNRNSAVGCRISGVKPDMVKGELSISTESCPNLYLITITERGMRASSSENEENARRISQDILNGYMSDIDSILGKVHPSTNASIFKFIAYKVQD